jgi:hypothetical protein
MAITDQAAMAMTDQVLVISTAAEVVVVVVVDDTTTTVDLLVVKAEETRPRRMVNTAIIEVAVAVDVVVTVDEVVVAEEAAGVVAAAVAVDRRIRTIQAAVAASRPLRLGPRTDDTATITVSRWKKFGLLYVSFCVLWLQLAFFYFVIAKCALAREF